jgi:hypothetical protein
MPEAFGIKSGKSPNLGRIKAKKKERIKKGREPLTFLNLLEQLFDFSETLFFL